MTPDAALTGSMQQLLDIMDQAAALFDLDGTVLMANEIGASRLGLTRDALLGRNVYDLLPPVVAGFRRELLAEVARSGRPAHFTDQSDGRWLEHRVCPVHDSKGRVARFAVYTTDVTERRLADQERAARNAELETIHAHVPVGILLLDADRRIIKANQTAAALAGRPRDQIIDRIAGAGLGCLSHLDDARGCGHGPDCGRCELRLAVHRALDEDLAVDALPVSLTVDGPRGPEVRNVLLSAAPVTIAGSRNVLVSLQDITRLRRAEADVALKAMVLDQIQDRVTVTDLEGRVVYVNNAACRSLRIAREELVGRSVTAFGDDPSRGATQMEIVARTLADGHWQGEVVNIAGDGTSAVLHCRTTVVRDETDVPVGMCGIATDITERRRWEDQLLESERRFRRLHEQLPIGYFGLDREGRYVDANPAWLCLLGCERDGIERHRFEDRLAGAHAGRFAAARARVQAGREEQVEFEIVGSDERAVTVFCVGRGGRDEHGAITTTHWVAADVSARRRLESQLWQAQKLDALGRLAAGVSHDFNNQLTVISGYCDLLLSQTPDDAPQRQAMLQIRRATERAASTTGHLLSFSRKRELTPRNVDINVLVRELLHPLGKLIGDAIRLRTEMSPRLRTVCVDPVALQQAIFNLILNARDAMQAGGNLTLRTSNRPAPTGVGADLVALVVEDSGCGIAPDDLERVFEPFFTTKAEGKGTGLGLPMVRGLVEQSGGSVEIRSEVGAGTVVTLLLPAVTADDGSATVLEPVTGEERLSGRLLVVEDSEQVRDLVVDVLRRRGAEVVAAASPGEALAIAASNAPFDLLITDVVMPGLRGDELAARLLAQRRVGRVMYMSGYHGGAIDEPAGILLPKPFAVRDLLASVQRSLAGEPVAAEPLEARSPS